MKGIIISQQLRFDTRIWSAVFLSRNLGIISVRGLSWHRKYAQNQGVNYSSAESEAFSVGEFPELESERSSFKSWETVRKKTPDPTKAIRSKIARVKFMNVLMAEV